MSDCLLPNHWHFVRWPEKEGDLAGFMQHLTVTRVTRWQHNRRDFSIIIDEFQNYATPGIATFLSEARKYRTHLILSHEFTEQLSPEILAAILGNVGSMLVFQLGAPDAELFGKQLGRPITADHLMNIPKFHAYCRLLLDCMPSRPFSMETIASHDVQLRRASSTMQNYANLLNRGKD